MLPARRPTCSFGWVVGKGHCAYDCGRAQVVFASSVGITNSNILGSTILNRILAFFFSIMWGALVTRFAPMRLFAVIIVLAACSSVTLVLMHEQWHYWLLSVL